MSQYSSLFNNTRIPMTNQDVLHNNASGKHIVVMRRGHFYKLDVLDNQGTYKFMSKMGGLGWRDI